jgi:hypothetical protein
MDIEGRECPTCGKVCKSRRGVKQHHAKSHGEEIGVDTVERDCANCGDVVETTVYNAEKSEISFCGKTCESEYKTGSSKPSSWDVVRLTCDECGDIISKQPRNVNESNNFCDMECYGEWRKGKKTGEDNPTWNGGFRMDYSGETWREKRKRAVERDGRKCVLCGVKEDELENPLDVHHITPAWVFREGEGHNLENLMSLCRSCHAFVERMFTPDLRGFC